jgi:hypothetical protein
MTTTTSYFYSYITTTSYRTTYTITVPLRQSGYSLTGEFRGDLARLNGCTDEFLDQSCWQEGVECYEYTCESQTPSPSQVLSSLTANGRRIVGEVLYLRANETVRVNAGVTSYTYSGRSADCWVECSSEGCYCVKRIREWNNKYKFQAIELVDWDTGEVYVFVNQNSLTFNINRNTIVRFIYVIESGWTREWTVIFKPPPPSPEKCQQILNDPSKIGSPEWCECARIYDPQAYKEICDPIRTCYYVSVNLCCSGASGGCTQSFNPKDGSACGSTPTILTASWSASWVPSPGWRYKTWGWQGDGICSANVSGNSISGTCRVNAESNYRSYGARVWIIFEQTS